MVDEWQLRRSELNHQWLKNEFIRHLRAFIQRLSRPEPDERRLAEFVRADWPKLAERRDDLANLLATAEDALSPRQVLEEPPLSSCGPETRAWLSRLVHALWLQRTPIRRRVEEASAALGEVWECYVGLDQVVERAGPDELRSAAKLFSAFAAKVDRLSRCLTELPSRIEVV